MDITTLLLGIVTGAATAVVGRWGFALIERRVTVSRMKRALLNEVLGTMKAFAGQQALQADENRTARPAKKGLRQSLRLAARRADSIGNEPSAADIVAMLKRLPGSFTIDEAQIDPRTLPPLLHHEECRIALRLYDGRDRFMKNSARYERLFDRVLQEATAAQPVSDRYLEYWVQMKQELWKMVRITDRFVRDSYQLADGIISSSFRASIDSCYVKEMTGGRWKSLEELRADGTRDTASMTPQVRVVATEGDSEDRAAEEHISDEEVAAAGVVPGEVRDP